jgi:hypothetical protein
MEYSGFGKVLNQTILKESEKILQGEILVTSIIYYALSLIIGILCLIFINSKV